MTQIHSASFAEPHLSLYAGGATLLAPATPLIGREQERAQLADLLQRPAVRLVTLLGAPGVGKTRLALQVAHDTGGRYADGVVVVSLAALRDPELVLSAIGQALGLQIASSITQLEQVVIHLQRKEMLLVLDNFEQVMAAARTIAQLLALTTHLKILVTSRNALHLSSETEFSLSPLKTPEPGHFPAQDLLIQYPSVALFVARAQAVRPDFQLTAGNAAVIAQICWHLEGLPLAIELAAARSKLLPPQALLARLTHRLTTLTGGARDLPERQQTLRNAIVWSYELLQAEQKRLFRGLSVFVNGCTLEAAETILAIDSSLNIVDGLAALLDHSLLQRTETLTGDVRFSMLELIREFAREALIAQGEEPLLRQRHAEFYLELAEAIEPQLVGPNQEEGLNQLESEFANLRAALTWSVDSRNLELLLRLTTTLGQFWWRHGHFTEERHWLSLCLELTLPALEDTTKRTEVSIANFEYRMAGLLYSAGAIAWHHGDWEQAVTFCSKSLEIYRALGEKQFLPRAIRILALAAMDRGDFLQSRQLLEESLALCRELKDARGIGWSLSFLGRAAAGLDENENARSLLQESLARFRQMGEKDGIIYQLQYLSMLALKLDEVTNARQLIQESLELAQQLGHKGALADALRTLGQITLRQNQIQAALLHLKAALVLYQTLGNLGGTADCYLILCEIATQMGEREAANRFHWAAEEVRNQINLSLTAPTSAAYSMHLQKAHVLTVEEAILLLENRAEQVPAIAELPGDAPPVTSAQTSAPALAELTSREVQVLHLIAQGLTYAQIAEQLVVSPRTVDAHLRAIYSKLGVRSRHEAAAFARQHQLVP